MNEQQQLNNLIDFTTKRDEKRARSGRRRSALPNGTYRSDEVCPERIVWIRELLSFSQEDFAEVLGITVEMMQAWEQGSEMPTIGQLEQMALMSGMVTAGWFCKPVPEGWPGWEETSLRFH